jgi:hypothetical protein
MHSAERKMAANSHVEPAFTTPPLLQWTHHVNHHFPKRLLLLFCEVDENITVGVLVGVIPVSF